MNADAILDSVFERSRNEYLFSTPEELANEILQEDNMMTAEFRVAHEAAAKAARANRYADIVRTDEKELIEIGLLFVAATQKKLIELANDHAQSETNGYDLDTHAA